MEIFNDHRKANKPNDLVFHSSLLIHASQIKEAGSTQQQPSQRSVLSAEITFYRGRTLIETHSGSKMAKQLDNENPTILSVSELPSRRQRRQRKEKYAIPGGIEEMFFSKPSYEMNPYYTLEYSDADSEDSNIEPIDEQEIYDLIAPISDPEHPLSLESLGVVKLQDVHLSSPLDPAKRAALSRVLVELTPTVSHCSLATVIGLGVRVRLEQTLPPSFRVEVKIKKDTHAQADEVNKQLADKERVAAALENKSLMGILRKMIQPCLDPQDIQ